MDILLVAAVAARRFFTTVLEALHAVPDGAYDSLDPALRAALTGSSDEHGGHHGG